MFQQPDSTAHIVEAIETSVSMAHGQPESTEEVLERLPADATPSQQDSAVQATFHIENLHLNARPDTLVLPERTKEQGFEGIDATRIFGNGFFSNDSFLHTEVQGGLYGVAGDPMPYSIRTDNVLTSLLLGCFILAMLAFAKSRRFIQRQVKGFFREPRALTTEMPETMGEFHFQFFLVLQTCLLCSILSFLYTRETVGDVFMLDSPYQLVAIFFGVLVAYFVMKELLYAAVNAIFFGAKKTGRWFRTHIFVVAIQGVALFPLVLLQSYFDLSLQNAIIYAAFVVVLVRILLVYKCFVIFFKQKSFVLQIILYFCALEIMPLLMLCGVMDMIIGNLKVNI